MSKILRIDLQGSFNDSVYDNTEELRLQLIDFHSSDYDDCRHEEAEDYKPIQEFTLENILNYGDWDYKIITDKEAKEIEDEEEEKMEKEVSYLWIKLIWMN